MILYLDTSSLVKLYIQEEASEAVRELVDEADVVATSVLAYPEAFSGFSRKQREGGLSLEEHLRAKGELARDWPYFLLLQVTEPIYRQAAELTSLYSLRAYDSVHLASFLALAAGSQAVRFSSFDDRLSSAAEVAVRQSPSLG